MLPTSLQLAAQRSVSKKAKPLPAGSEFVRLLDPGTEMLITRLTSLTSNSFLPAATNQFISTKEHFLVFSSDRTGRNSPFRLDLRTGTLNQLASSEDVQPQSLCLDAAHRTLSFLDGSTLKEVELKSQRTRVLEEGITAFSLGPSPADVVVVKKEKLCQLSNQKVVLAEGVAGWCALRPGGSGCLFGRETSMEEREFWYVPLNRPQGKAVLLAKGRISSPCWSPDGKSVLFLRETLAGNVIRSAIYEVSPETCAEGHVANTSQFASFAPNADESVFVGASRSKAQPAVVILLRTSGRELTLCEHGSKNAEKVSPVFSPDSRRVYFQSDREGKSALYSVNVESLVEPT
jgi:oligogalacturonide lyase